MRPAGGIVNSPVTQVQTVGESVRVITAGLNQKPPCQSKNGEKSVGSESDVQRDGPAVVQIHLVGRQICWLKLTFKKPF